ncbi:MAG: type II secretion system F family protein [Candidatus Diapherotrites archaeon]|nr:type II secretion system F family protein [Candidatus Diapherotrites archaeon]
MNKTQLKQRLFLNIEEPEKQPNQISLLENNLIKNSSLRNKDFEKHKNESLKISIIFALFTWLCAGVFAKNILLALGIAFLFGIMVFTILLYLPILKKKAHARKVEAELPLFLLRLATEIKLGKSMAQAIKDSAVEKDSSSKEFLAVANDILHGMSFQEALEKMNSRLGSLNIKRASSSLSNIQLHGGKDITGLKKIAQELLMKQRIESKEFSGKIIVYSLVFIAVSAIVPAMFQSFLLIGSYFMSIRFTAQEAFIITVCIFPTIDIAILYLIEAKTPLFLKQ